MRSSSSKVRKLPPISPSRLTSWLAVTKSTTVEQMKNEVLQRPGSSPSTHRVKLIMAGKLLQPDSAPVASFGVTEGAFVHAVVSKKLPTSIVEDVEAGDTEPLRSILNPRGLDRLQLSARMSAEQVQAIRMAFRDSISQHGALVPRGEDEEEAAYRFRVEEDWMRAQEEDSEYAANLSDGSGPRASALHLSGEAEMQLGTYRDFIYGFAMGFVLGIFMLVGIWDGNVTYRQKVGILFGVLLNLIMSSNSSSRTSS